MTHHKTYLGSLDDHAKLHPDRPIFWIPQSVDSGKPVNKWTPITFGHFHRQTYLAKQFYASHIAHLGIARGSVIGLWLSGNEYTDVIQTFGVSAAGFIPELFSLYYSHAPVVFELLIKSGAKALVVNTQLTGMPDLSGCPVKLIDISKMVFEVAFGDFQALQERPYAEVQDDVAVILHSSGSTAGIPKLIPWTNSFITTVFRKSLDVWLSEDCEEVHCKMGNFNHGAAMLQILGCVCYGASILMPSSLAFSMDELLNMIQLGGLTRLTQLTPLMVPHLERARTDPIVLSALKSLRSVVYAGMPLQTGLETWCQSAGLYLTNFLACTECGFLLLSSPPTRSSLMKPLPGLSYKLLPLEGQVENEVKLLELVILPDSPELPHSSLLAPDGNFYTGDLFEPVENDHYLLFKGRKNDWIKTGVGLLCDTKSIEEAVAELCKDIVFDCVVVGTNRRCPALLLEPLEDIALGRDDIPQTIVERLATFNKRRFPHERLEDPGLILVVERGVLPRTAAKGNIRRRAAEELFLKELDEMYRVTAPAKVQLY